MALAVILVTASCTSDGSSDTDVASTSTAPPTATTAPPLPFDPEPVVWEPCEPTHDCATLTVPLDWSHPNGTTTDVAMIRIPARKPDRRLGSLVVNPGGPGATGVGSAALGVYPDAANNRFDIIGWDPRGVGLSSPFTCGDTVDAWYAADPDPDTPAEARALDQAARAVADECAAEDGDLLPFVGADAEAHDLEAMRIALGEDTLNFLGYSAGTTIGARYAALYPTHLRSMVLDGVVDPTNDHAAEYLGQAVEFEQGLDEIFASCRADPDCPVDDPERLYDELRADVERHRIPGGADGVGPGAYQRAAAEALADEAEWPGYLQALADARDGNGGGLVEMSDSFLFGVPFTTYVGIWCMDEPHPVGAEAWDAAVERIVDAAPRLGEFDANEMRPCAYWPAEPTRPLDPVVAPGAPPILVVGNTGDHITPYEEARSTAEALDDGHLLTVEAIQHTSLGIPCAETAVVRYLVRVEPPTHDC